MTDCKHENTKHGTFVYNTVSDISIDVDYEICLDCGMSCSESKWTLNPHALRQEYLQARDRTKETILALIEKYGDPQYKTNEFAIYDLISVAQQLQTQLRAKDKDKVGKQDKAVQEKLAELTPDTERRMKQLRKTMDKDKLRKLADSCIAYVPKMLKADLIALLDEVEAKSEAIDAFVKDFESDFVVDGVIVDHPEKLWGNLLAYYRLCKSLKGGE